MLLFLLLLELAYAFHLSVEFMQLNTFTRRFIYGKSEGFLEIELTIEVLMTTLEWLHMRLITFPSVITAIALFTLPVITAQARGLSSSQNTTK